jgi:membrane fusion protein, multidrug efflux system
MARRVVASVVSLPLWLVVVGLLTIGCARQPAPVEVPPPKVGAVEVLSVEIADEGRFSGRTAAPQRVDITAQIDGVVRERFFVDGQRVARGDPLFAIDARSPEAALAQARAELARAQVDAANAAQVASTNEQLHAQSIIGREEYQQSKAAAEAATALVRAQKAIVNGAALTRGRATVIAPFDGRVGEAEVEVGGVVGPGSGPLAGLARVDPIYFDFALSEREFLGLPQHRAQREQIRERGQPSERLGFEAINERLLVALELADGSIHPYRGVLSRVSNEIDPQTGSYPMRAIFPNAEELLIPGLYGRVIIRLRAKRPALLIPQDATVLEQSGVVVYVVDPSGQASKRRVELGQRIGALVEVRSGLAAGDRVVREGVHKCRDGLRVEAVELAPLSLDSDPLAREPIAGSEGWYERFLAERRVAALAGN